MLKRIIVKLKNRRAETLLETLVSLLIAVLSVTLLTSAVTAAARINKTTKEADAIYKEELAEAETADGTASEKSVTITFDGASGISPQMVDVTVNVYGSGNYASYQKK